MHDRIKKQQAGNEQYGKQADQRSDYD